MKYIMRWRDINYLNDFYNDEIVVYFGNYQDFSAQDISFLSEEEMTRASLFSDSSERARYLAGKKNQGAINRPGVFSIQILWR